MYVKAVGEKEIILDLHSIKSATICSVKVLYRFYRIGEGCIKNTYLPPPKKKKNNKVGRREKKVKK